MAVKHLALALVLVAGPAGAQSLLTRPIDPYGFAVAATPVVAEPAEYVPPAPNGVRAAGEIVAVNLMVWSYDRFVREGGGAGFRVGIQSWKQNMLNGFEWDDNTFNTNQFAHPYHGSLYYNAARANGFDYWTSAPFAFGGSFLWEYFGETHHPSVNDWFATSLGGIALGETLFRLSTAVTDNTRTGGARVLGEVFGTIIDPMRGINRVISGEAGRVGPNPPDRYPKFSGISYQVGARATSEESVWNADTTRAYVQILARYGDPFLGDRKKPFDSFDFDLQINFGDASSIGKATAHGLLYAADVTEHEGAHHMLGVFQNFDYENTNAYVFGSQGVGLSFLSRVGAASRFEVRSSIDLNALLLAATNSDHANISGRTYDYGPGLGFRFAGAFHVNGRPFLTIADTENWIHVFNGTPGDHILSSTHIRLELPIQHGLGVGADYVQYRVNRDYDDFPSVDRTLPELRLSAAYNL